MCRRDYGNRRREAMAQRAWKRKQEERRLAEDREAVERSGLLCAGKEATFFRTLNVGEERNTGFRSQGQWWAPAYLVRLNKYLKKYGISHKLRVRTIRSYLENKPPPGSVLDALAGYTEEQLLRK